MRWKSTLRLIVLGLGVSLVLAGIWTTRRERLRDAWALFSGYTPACEAGSDGRDVGDGVDLSPRALAARRALDRETLAVVEELAARGRSKGHRLLAESVAAAREVCNMGAAGSGAALAQRLELTDLETQRRRSAAHADLRFSRRRLEDLVSMTDEEREARADRYAERLADAVSREMLGWTEAPPSPAPPPPRLPVAEVQWPPTSAAAASKEKNRPPDADDDTPGAEVEPRIVIHSTSGESWSQIRSRRARERMHRLRAWRPVASRALERVMKLRRALGRLLETDSLAGGADLCARLGAAAQETDRIVVRGAPDRVLSSAMARMLEGYELAGRACSEARYSTAFLALSEADDAWSRVVGAPGAPRRLR